MKKIIIIGGAPATGKTTLAKTLSDKFNYPWISTDFIRGWMKTLVSKKDFPNLFNFSDITAEEHYSNNYDIKKSIKSEQKRDADVFKGVKSFISKNKYWGCFIIEGISIHPKDISQLESQEYKIYPIFLIDENIDRIRDILYSRGLWDKADTYEDWVKEIELEYLIQTNAYYLEECKKLNLPYFKIDKNREKTIEKIFTSFKNNNL
ncbi:MAG: hypothetical protein N4A38_02400 [Candidatus Gracilibacteria bacterium]|nr:hypothetical protein [Candidatus Gracilibacteria bacterium]